MQSFHDGHSPDGLIGEQVGALSEHFPSTCAATPGYACPAIITTSTALTKNVHSDGFVVLRRAGGGFYGEDLGSAAAASQSMVWSSIVEK